MKNSWEQWVKDKVVRKWFQRDNLMILILSGVLLFIIALPTNKGAEKASETGWESVPVSEKGEGALAEEAGESEKLQSTREYCAYLEKRLESTLEDVAGAGRVKVMITLEASEELVVEKDKPVNRSHTDEQDSQGGSRTASQTDIREATVYTTENGKSDPYVVKTLLPRVEGVVVVAQGAGSGTVNKSITEMVQALFDVEAHKIKVVKMETAG